jgi:hypothetical protein
MTISMRMASGSGEKVFAIKFSAYYFILYSYPSLKSSSILP